MIRLGLRLVLFALIAGSLTDSGLAQEKKTPEKKAEEVTAKTESPVSSTAATLKLKPEPFKIEVSLTGVFEADKTSPVVLRPKSWASFSVIKAVPHGKKVKKGETLVWLEMAQIDEKLQDAKTDLELGKLAQQLADTELRLLKETTPMDLEAAARTKRIADEDLKYFLEVSRPHSEESARFSLKSSQQSLEYAEEELKQLEEMYKADDLTEETEEIVLKRARNDVERSKYYLKSAELRTKRTLTQDLPREEQQMRDAAKRADVAWARAKVSLPVQLAKKELEREKQTVVSKRALESYNKLRKDREIMLVKSPADGYVYYGRCKRGKWSGVDTVGAQLRPGGKLAANSAFMTIVSPRPMHIRVDVPEKELHRLRPNLKGKAVPTGYPELELPTALRQVSPFPIATGVFDGQFQVTLDNKNQAIVPGMGCKLTLTAYEKKNALAVPASAVFEDEAGGQRNVVYVAVPGGKPVKRKVTVGQKTEAKWEITRGLKAGEEILLKKPE